METEVQPDSGSWVFVVAWRWRQDSAGIFNTGLARDGSCCHCLYHAYESCAEFCFHHPPNKATVPRSDSLEASSDRRSAHVCLGLLQSCSIVPSLYCVFFPSSYLLSYSPRTLETLRGSLCITSEVEKEGSERWTKRSLSFGNATDRWLMWQITTLLHNFPPALQTIWANMQKYASDADFLFQTKLYMTAGLLLNLRKQLSQ